MRRFVAPAGLLVGAVLAFPGGALSHDGQEHGPPPPGQVAQSEDTYRYKGGTIARDSAAAKGLACFKRGAEKTRCYDTEREMDVAERLQPNPKKFPVQARQYRKRSKRTARAATHDGSALRVYQHTSYNGWVVATYSHCQWYDLQGSYNDAVSSLSAGSHTGFLGWNADGSGGTYSIGAHGAHADIGEPWNDDASARARTCL